MFFSISMIHYVHYCHLSTIDIFYMGWRLFLKSMLLYNHNYSRRAWHDIIQRLTYLVHGLDAEETLRLHLHLEDLAPHGNILGHAHEAQVVAWWVELAPWNTTRPCEHQGGNTGPSQSQDIWNSRNIFLHSDKTDALKHKPITKKNQFN